MTSHTTKIECPKCRSEDCNFTAEELGKAIKASMRTATVRCNKCTYTKVSVLISGHELFTEEQILGNEETILSYMFLGQEKG